MEQYLQALREREDVSEEVLLELEERFKVVEEEPPEPVYQKSLSEEIEELKQIIDILMGGEDNE